MPITELDTIQTKPHFWWENDSSVRDEDERLIPGVDGSRLEKFLAGRQRTDDWAYRIRKNSTTLEWLMKLPIWGLFSLLCIPLPFLLLALRTNFAPWINGLIKTLAEAIAIVSAPPEQERTENVQLKTVDHHHDFSYEPLYRDNGSASYSSMEPATAYGCAVDSVNTYYRTDSPTYSPPPPSSPSPEVSTPPCYHVDGQYSASYYTNAGHTSGYSSSYQYKTTSSYTENS